MFFFSWAHLALGWSQSLSNWVVFKCTLRQMGLVYNLIALSSIEYTTKSHILSYYNVSSTPHQRRETNLITFGFWVHLAKDGSQTLSHYNVSSTPHQRRESNLITFGFWVHLAKGGSQTLSHYYVSSTPRQSRETNLITLWYIE